jgi:hypothetical protein
MIGPRELPCRGFERDSNIKAGERKQVGEGCSDDGAYSQLHEITNLRGLRALYIESSVAFSHFENTRDCLLTEGRRVYSRRVQT